MTDHTIKITDFHDHLMNATRMMETAMKNPGKIVQADGYETGVSWNSELSEWGVWADWADKDQVKFYAGHTDIRVREKLLAAMIGEDISDGKTLEDAKTTQDAPGDLVTREYYVEVGRDEFHVVADHIGKCTNFYDSEWDRMFSVPVICDAVTAKHFLITWKLGWDQGQKFGEETKAREVRKVLGIQ